MFSEASPRRRRRRRSVVVAPSRNCWFAAFASPFSHSLRIAIIAETRISTTELPVVLYRARDRSDRDATRRAGCRCLSVHFFSILFLKCPRDRLSPLPQVLSTSGFAKKNSHLSHCWHRTAELVAGMTYGAASTRLMSCLAARLPVSLAGWVTWSDAMRCVGR